MEQLQQQFDMAANNYLVLLDEISEMLNDDENFNMDEMDPYDYIAEYNPEITEALMRAYALMNYYGEQLEAAEGDNNEI